MLNVVDKGVLNLNGFWNKGSGVLFISEGRNLKESREDKTGAFS